MLIKSSAIESYAIFTSDMTLYVKKTFEIQIVAKLEQIEVASWQIRDKNPHIHDPGRWGPK